MQEGTLPVVSVTIHGTKKKGGGKGTFSFLYGPLYFSMKKYSINILKNMHSDVYKIHLYLEVATYIFENRLCKTFPHNLGTNAATYLFVFAYKFWDGEGEMSMLFIR